jgi:hypothetical protein
MTHSWHSWFLVLLIFSEPTPGCAQTRQMNSHQVAEEVFPPLGPAAARLRFHTGATKDNQPEISPVLPDIPGPASPWFVTQWSQRNYMLPNSMTRNDPATRDSRLGAAVYAFTAPDRHSHVWVYELAIGQDPVYELYEEGGELTDSGGSNIFLSANAFSEGMSLDKMIEYQLDAKLSKAQVEFTTADAKQNGSVLAQVFTGFVIHYPDPFNGKESTLFLQIPHSASNTIGDYRACDVIDGKRAVTYNNHLPGDRVFNFGPYKGPLVHLQYSLNAYLCDLIDRPLRCRTSDGTTSVTLRDGVKDFANWKIKSMYVGLETQTEDLRPQSKDRNAQGSVSVALQFSNLHVLRHPGRDFAPSDCANGS